MTAGIPHVLGCTMQVGWAGTTMCPFDLAGGQGVKLKVFLESLPYSRMQFAVACPNERQDSWLDVHRRMLESFGGIAEVIVPDNTSTASDAISAADRNWRIISTDEEFM
ncbi:transposase [Corynebacterium sp. NML180780]|uniref:transposase n=1 Tax=Corynebacterium sp. NML180780 TaxID=2598459 RepID=UPI00118F5526|nr:transposase [Corynebacterium sp. NML180780]TVX76463.1 transposase [Corynebacterium sp. NML180780]